MASFGPLRRLSIMAIEASMPSDLREFIIRNLHAEPEDLFAIVGLWAAVAQSSDLGASTLAAVRAGRVQTHDIGDVFPALTGML